MEVKASQLTLARCLSETCVVSYKINLLNGARNDMNQLSGWAFCLLVGQMVSIQM